MALALQRCRFVDYTPSGVQAMCYFHLGSTPGSHRRADLRLAVARSNGDIEIFGSIGQGWFCERVLSNQTAGSGEMTVTSLAWAGGMLLATGLHDTITGWDVNTLRPVASCSTYGGAAWGLAARPDGEAAAVACEDGCVRLFDVSFGEITYARAFPKGDGRALSVAWHPSGKDFLAAGYADALIRIFDTESFTVRQVISLTAGAAEQARKGGKRGGGDDDEEEDTTCVWSLAALRDGTVISGDSRGSTQFWDSSTGTLMSAFPQHQGDVLCVTVDPSEQHVFSAGADARIAHFSRVASPSGSAGGSGIGGGGAGLVGSVASQSIWVHASSTRPHTHDIAALAVSPSYVFPPKAGGVAQHQIPKGAFSLLASAGADCQIAIHVPSLFESKEHRPLRLAPFPPACQPVVSMVPAPAQLTGGSAKPSQEEAGQAPTGSLLLARLGSSMHIWHLGSGAQLPESDDGRAGLQDGQDLSVSAPPCQLLEIKTSSQLRLVASALSPDGRMVACSDGVRNTRLFALSYTAQKAQQGVLASKKRKDGSGVDRAGVAPQADVSCACAKLEGVDFSEPASCLAFSPDGSKLFAATLDGYITVVSTNAGAGEDCVLSKFTEHAVGKAAGGFVTSMVVSSDGRWLASGSSASNAVHVHDLQSMKWHATLPSLDHAGYGLHTAMAFHPAHATLAVAYAANSVAFYDVEQRRFSDFTRDMTGGAAAGSAGGKQQQQQQQQAAVPPQLADRRDKILGVAFNPHSAGTGVVLWSSSYIVLVDTDRPALAQKAPVSEPVAAGKKRKSTGPQNGKKAGKKGSGDSPAAGKANFVVVDKFQPIIGASFVGGDQLALVERPWDEILRTLPPSMVHTSYGT